jgi:hypothetical protein
MAVRWSELSRKHQEYVISFGVVLALFILSSAFLDLSGIFDFYTIPTPPYEIPGLISGLGALTSVILSAGLLYLYDKQRDVLNEQKQLTEYQQTALPRIEDHELVSYESTKNYQDEHHSTGGNPDNLVLYQTEYLELDLSNVGLAPAHDLRVEFYVEAGDESYTAALPVISGNWQSAISRLHGENKTTVFLNTEGNAIASDSDIETHTVPLTVLTENIPESWKEFGLHRWPPAQSVIHCAKTNTDADITAGLLLWFKDGRGPVGPQYIRFVDVPRDDVLTTKEAVRDDDLEYEDATDLNGIFGDVGSATEGDALPDIKHPDER